MSGSPNLGSISTRLRRIAHLAREDRERSFLSLAHYVDEYWLMEAYSRTRKDGAPGVDGQTAKQYAEDLEENLRSLLDRFKSGRYKAPPVKRVEIPKGSGSEARPIGIPTFEDKVLQRAVAMVLEVVYEQDFLDCSYGFRPNRSAHDFWASVEGPKTHATDPEHPEQLNNDGGLRESAIQNIDGNVPGGQIAETPGMTGVVPGVPKCERRTTEEEWSPSQAVAW